MNCYRYRTSLLLILVVVIAGCNQSAYPPVSGKVTMDGEPVPAVTVVFTPVGSASAPTPGPYSSGVTDEQGNFTLRTRRDDAGAVPGPHRVGIEYADQEKMRDLKFNLREADDESKPAIKKQIKELRTLFKSRIKVPADVIYKFEVPKEGTSKANFELDALELNSQ